MFQSFLVVCTSPEALASLVGTLASTFRRCRITILDRIVELPNTLLVAEEFDAVILHDATDGDNFAQVENWLADASRRAVHCRVPWRGAGVEVPADWIEGLRASLLARAQFEENRATPRDVLSDRQSAVFSRLAEGLMIKQIAEQLKVSPATVKHHLTKIYKALGVTNRTQALLVAKRSGWPV